MELWIATTNTGKIREFERLLEGLPITIKTTKDLSYHSAPLENGLTFLDNARIKAKSVRSIKNDQWVLADDSGLEVEGLGGLPGIHSARYAGQHAKDMENCLKVLKMLHLKAATNRAARFICTVVLLSPTGEESVFEGTLEGTIAKEMKGRDGFGYDPIFIPKDDTKTLAELGLAVKNRLSHRALAAKKVADFLRTKT